MSRPPLPGTKVRGSSSGKPIMALLDLLGRRWAMRLVWELRAGARTSRELRAACGVSPAVLSARMKELRTARFVTLEPVGGYALSALGQELLQRFSPLVTWADRWALRTRSRGSRSGARARR